MPRPNPSQLANHSASPIDFTHSIISCSNTGNALAACGCFLCLPLLLLLLLALTASMTQLPSKVFYAVFGFLSRRRQRRQPSVEWRMNDQNVSKLSSLFIYLSLSLSLCLCFQSLSLRQPLQARLNRCAVTGQKIFA